MADTPHSMTPQEIVSELDRHIVGQKGAKRAVAIALRNRWRRQQVDEKLRGEITPKNILMIGPTGVGKTEIARRLARLADAPFIKVEATKFTEVGYVGKDVDTIVRDLVDVAIKQERERQVRRKRALAEDAAEERVLDILVPPPRDARGEIGFAAAAPAPDNTARQVMRKRLREGALDDKEIEIEVADAKPSLEILGPQGMEEMAEQLKGLFSQMGQAKRKTRKLKIGEALKLLVDEEAGVAEVVRNAIKVDCWDLDEMTNQVASILRHRPLRDELSDRGRREVGLPRFALDEPARLTAATYRAATARRSNPGALA